MALKYIFLCLVVPSIHTAGEKKILHILGLYSIEGAWRGGYATKTAIEMGLEDINARDDILPDYKLEVTWENTKCDPGTVVNRMFHQLYKPPSKVMILGAACSTVSEATAIASHQWNLVQLSYVSGSPALSNTIKFPMFFRVTAPSHLRNPARVKMIKRYNWKHVATIHQSVELFSKTTEHLIGLLQENNITLISSEIFTNDPTEQIKNLKRHDARIIISACYEDKIYKLLCEAYKEGLYGQKYVWFIASFYANEWWKRETVGTDCTVEQITKVAEGAFGFGRLYMNRKEIKALSELTPEEWRTMFWKRMEGLSDYGAETAPLAYDSIWAAALALNLSEHELIDQGSSKRLSDFSYNDTEIASTIYRSMYKVEFQGIKGWIRFDENGDSADNVRIRRIQGGVRKLVGYYYPVKEEFESVPDSPIIWEDGSPPLDSTTHISKKIFVHSTTYIIMCLLAAFGIALSVFFFIFNIAYRNMRLIKMSSPRMNNVIVVGCAITYIPVFLQETSDSEVLTMCKVRTYSLMVGFSLAFGALFAKTWRVYAIFMNRTKKVIIKDEKLMLIVAAIVGIDIVIAVTREVVDPVEITSNIIGTIELDGGDVIITNSNWICTSGYDTYFKGVIYCIKGILLIFGAFLAMQTRKVKIAALNDSQYIGMCIYNVAVLSLLGVVLAFALTDQVDLAYIFTCGTIILGTTSTQLIIFIPKIINFKAAKSQVEDEESTGEHSTTKTTMATINTVDVNRQVKDELQQTRGELEEAKATIIYLRKENAGLKANR